MKVFTKCDEIPSTTLQDIKETKRYGHTFVRSDGRTDGQRENNIPSHKHSLRGYNKLNGFVLTLTQRKLRHRGQSTGHLFGSGIQRLLGGF